jgi:hypothetical protein
MLLKAAPYITSITDLQQDAKAWAKATHIQECQQQMCVFKYLLTSLEHSFLWVEETCGQHTHLTPVGGGASGGARARAAGAAAGEADGAAAAAGAPGKKK